MHGEITFVVLPHRDDPESTTLSRTQTTERNGHIRHMRALFDYDPEVRFIEFCVQRRKLVIENGSFMIHIEILV
jgi:hypothetical protein